jgi:hypothetical protein
MLRARLEEEGRGELKARLQAGLDSLDPRMLELPAYEREVPAPPAEGERPRRQRR